MGTAQRPEGYVEVGTSWDGRARCRLCMSDSGLDHDWCPAARALVCDECCDEVLSGRPAKLLSAAAATGRLVMPLEILAACASCERLARMLADEEDPDESSAASRLH